MLAALAVLAGPAAAEGPDTIAVPAEVRPFVPPATRPIALERADLDGDGTADFVLVVERRTARPSDDAIEDGQRPLLVLTHRADGSLELAARNDKVVYCSTCGGMMGDPFQGVEAGPKTFTVSHMGGSAWRWTADYRFAWSRRDRTWELVRVTESSFHASAPDRVKTRIATPPRDFGKIALADFDPRKWRGQGRR
jgi:hypothetical protein